MKKKDLTQIFKKTDKKNYYYYDRDYPVIACLYRRKLALMLSITINQQVKDYLDKLYITSPFVTRTYTDHNECGIILNYRKMTSDILKKLIEDLQLFLKQENIKNVCHISGNIGDVKVALMDDQIEIVSLETFNDQKDCPVTHKSHHLALFGSILFCILPLLIWIFLHDFGLIITLDGFLFGIMSYYGYKKFSPYINYLSVLFITMVSVMMLIIAQIFVIPLEIMDVFSYSMKINITYFQAFSILPEMITDLELIKTMSVYLGISIVFILISLIILLKRSDKLDNQYKLY